MSGEKIGSGEFMDIPLVFRDRGQKVINAATAQRIDSFLEKHNL